MCSLPLTLEPGYATGFLLIVAFRSQSARTILWSEIPGMEMHALTREGLLQQRRSSRFCPLVGSFASAEVLLRK